MFYSLNYIKERVTKEVFFIKLSFRDCYSTVLKFPPIEGDLYLIVTIFIRKLFVITRDLLLKVSVRRSDTYIKCFYESLPSFG